MTTVSAARLARLLAEAPRTRPAYRAVADGIKTLLADGRLTSGTRLPSERELTAALGCSRTTVARAYAVLRAENHLVSRRGSGSILTPPRGRGPARSSRVLSPGLDLDPDTIDLTCAATRAPAGLSEAYAAALAALPAYLDDSGYAPVGLPELRTLIAHRYTAAGLDTAPEQILITPGALAGLAVVARALLGPGSRVVTETPTYPNAVEALRRAGGRIVTIPVDPDGWDLSESARLIRGADAKLAYLVPDFHNPTGALLDENGRDRLAAALRAAGTVAIIDETNTELDLDRAGLDPPDKRPRPFACFAEDAITLGSTAKAFWGGLRIGWLRTPPNRADVLLDARATLDLGAPIMEQLVVIELLRRHPGLPPGRRTDLTAARDATASALRRLIPQARFGVPRGGLCLWVEVPDTPAGVLCRAAQTRGLLIADGQRFSPRGGFERFIRIPFVLPEQTMVEAVRRLAQAHEDAAGVRGGTPPTRGFIA